MSNDVIAFGAFLAVNLAAASSGAVFKPGPWYESLQKPSWTPPNWAFPTVWTTLYLLNAAAGWLVWRAGGDEAWGALTLYGVSLVFNALWSALFFGMRRMDWALIEAVALWGSIAVVMAAFLPVSPLATLLLAPYLAWVTLAAFLNLRMLQLNPLAGSGSAPVTR